MNKAVERKCLGNPDFDCTCVEGAGDQAYSSVDPYSADMFANLLEQRRFAFILNNTEIQITALGKNNPPNFSAAYASWLKQALKD